MKKVSIYLLLCVVAFTTGCPNYRPKQVNFKNPEGYVKDLNDYLASRQAYYLSIYGSRPEEAKRARNEAIETVLPYLDAAYADFVNDIARGRDRTNFVADLIELGTSAAVGITNGERPLQILGVALTAFRGGRRSADLNFYKDQSTPILISKMDGNRAKVRATILVRERDDVITYPISAAISDIVEYINAGTLVRAFTELQKDTAVNTRQAEDNLQVLKGVTLTPEATPEFRNLSVASLRVLQKLANDLNSDDAATKDAATRTLQKIVSALEKDTVAATVLKAAGVSSQETDGAKLRQGLIGVRGNAAEANNTELVNKINQAIVDNGQ
ncbi:MAG: hypothetical protein JO360_12880 [Acidobacteria bacterium]|nr:hypothetical protein [Acidobacteriota bacterium]